MVYFVLKMFSGPKGGLCQFLLLAASNRIRSDWFKQKRNLRDSKKLTQRLGVMGKDPSASMKEHPQNKLALSGNRHLSSTASAPPRLQGASLLPHFRPRPLVASDWPA